MQIKGREIILLLCARHRGQKQSRLDNAIRGHEQFRCAMAVRRIVAAESAHAGFEFGKQRLKGITACEQAFEQLAKQARVLVFKLMRRDFCERQHVAGRKRGRSVVRRALALRLHHNRLVRLG